METKRCLWAPVGNVEILNVYKLSQSCRSLPLEISALMFYDDDDVDKCCWWWRKQWRQRISRVRWRGSTRRRHVTAVFIGWVSDVSTPRTLTSTSTAAKTRQQVIPRTLPDAFGQSVWVPFRPISMDFSVDSVHQHILSFFPILKPESHFTSHSALKECGGRVALGPAVGAVLTLTLSRGFIGDVGGTPSNAMQCNGRLKCPGINA